MSSLFFRQTTDKIQEDVSLENSFAGPMGSSCWLIGGGPSLKGIDIELLNQSPIPKMCINLAGTGLVRPTFWTSYDPSQRFLRSVYLDPGIIKFVHHRRAMDLVPETTYKVCECPGLFFFHKDRERGYANFLSQKHQKIVDWNDSMVQAIDILYRLGFRTIYLAGCEMKISPTEKMFAHAGQNGVECSAKIALKEFLSRCEEKGISAEFLESLDHLEQYHFAERKPFRSAVATDFHYFRVAQFLRLSRQSMALSGMKLISVTEKSRLNDYFPFLSLEEACARIVQQIGDPLLEQTVGKYTDDKIRLPESIEKMRDFAPLHWNQKKVKKKISPEKSCDKNSRARARNDLFNDEAEIPFQEETKTKPVSKEISLLKEVERMKNASVLIRETA